MAKRPSPARQPAAPALNATEDAHEPADGGATAPSIRVQRGAKKSPKAGPRPRTYRIGETTNADARVLPRTKRRAEPDDIKVVRLIADAGEDGLHFDAIREEFVPRPVTQRVGELLMAGLFDEGEDEHGERTPKHYFINDAGLDFLRKHEPKRKSA